MLKKGCPIENDENIFSWGLPNFPVHVETYLSLECIVRFRKKGVACMFVPEFVIFWGKCSHVGCLCAVRWTFGQCSSVDYLHWSLLCVIAAGDKR